MSKKDEVKAQLESLARERALHHRAIRHADGLIYACGIQPTGRELICWLGHAGIRNNRDAIIFWVLNQISDPNWNPDDLEIGVLLNRLKDRIREITDYEM